MTIRITYSKEGKATPDMLSEQIVLDLIEQGVTEYHTSTDTIVLAARTLFIEDKIEKPIFIFNDEELEMDDSSNFTYYPDGFAEGSGDLLRRIIFGKRDKAITKAKEAKPNEE